MNITFRGAKGDFLVPTLPRGNKSSQALSFSVVLRRGTGLSLGQADVCELLEVDVCAAYVPGSPLPAFAEDDVEVDVCALAPPDPEPSLVEFVDEEVDVEACASGAFEPD
jgi:hypothetical protein